MKSDKSACFRKASSELTGWLLLNTCEIVTLGNIRLRKRPINYVQLKEIRCEIITIIRKTHLVWALLSWALLSWALLSGALLSGALLSGALLSV